MPAVPIHPFSVMVPKAVSRAPKCKQVNALHRNFTGKHIRKPLSLRQVRAAPVLWPRAANVATTVHPFCASFVSLAEYRNLL